MISVKKDFTTPPTKLNTDKRTALIKDALVSKSEHKVDKAVYRDGTIEALQAEIRYNNKCAYCECDTSAGAPMQVEHYRPKKAVTEDKAHGGYYWLAYEWSNLLLSCSKCNNRKRNRFPIEGTRVMAAVIGTDGLPEAVYLMANSIVFLAEKPLLLNPEIDEVEKDFVFLPDGHIKALTKKGKETIKVCNLDRKDLVLKRLSILNNYFDKIQAYLRDLLAQKISNEAFQYSLRNILSEILSLQDNKKEYSRFGYFMFVKFNLFFTARLGAKEQPIVKEAFDLFLRDKL
jgi:uncharacterized protein (TIGR02646 family)